MDWTDDQSRAYEQCLDWIRKGGRGANAQFYISGYAGTGKTSLARYIAREVRGRVLFGAFTGKAASVLRRKGCPNASTIHSLIYRPKGSSLGERIGHLETLIEQGDDDATKMEAWRKELEELQSRDTANFELQQDPEIKDAALVVIDESSMIDSKIGNDLVSFGRPVLWLGDPGQLPPVNGTPFLKREPDAMLDQIHRQAEGSAIIKLAHDIRRGERAKYGSFGDVDILRKADFDWDLVDDADQVICGKNITRHSIIRRIRKKRGIENLYPLKDEKLICVSNNHEEGLLNGVTCTAASDSEVYKKTIDIVIDYEGLKRDLTIDPGHFEESYGKRKSYPKRDTVDHFAFGYCITGHKSQGSQWDHVVICDDRMKVADPEFRQKWLYTCVTRAAKKLTIYA